MANARARFTLRSSTCAIALAIPLAAGCAAEPLPTARIGWTELPPSAPMVSTPTPPPPPVEVHAEGLVAASRLAVVRATLVYLAESSRSAELWFPSMDRLAGSMRIDSPMGSYTRGIRVALVTAVGGTYVKVDAHVAPVLPGATADAAPPILARIAALAAKDDGAPAKPVVGLMACGFVDPEGHASPDGSCWFGSGDGVLREAWVPSKGESDADTAWVSTPSTEVGAGHGVSIHGVRLATKLDVGRTFSLVSFSPTGGLGASLEEGSGAIVVAEQRLDGTPAFPLVVDEVIKRLKTTFDAHATSQKAAIAAGMTKSAKLLLPGVQATGPRRSRDAVVARWIPEKELLRVRIHRTIRDADYSTLDCGDELDSCADGSEFGVDFEVTYDVDKKGIVRRTEAGPVIALGDEPDEPVPPPP